MKFYAPFLLAATASAHFKVTYPGSIGFDDDKEAESPCGGFDVTSRTNVTDYPSGGLPFTILTTHPSATFTLKAALLSNTDDFQYLVAPVTQTGIGTFCLENVPGPAAWAGKEGVVQVMQSATDGSLYQCVAVKFTTAAAAADIPSVCTNTSGTSVEWSTIPSGAVLAGSNSTSIGTSTSTATTSAPSSSNTNAAGHIVASFGSAALMAAAAYVL